MSLMNDIWPEHTPKVDAFMHGAGWTPDEIEASWPKYHRALLRWYGGKFALSQNIISQIDVPHHCYTEVFGGAASLLIKKKPSTVEVLNDLDDDIVNLYRVVRDWKHGVDLVRAVRMTPYSRSEYLAAHDPASADDPVERARRTLVRQSMSYSPQVHRDTARATSFRNNSSPGRVPAHDWRGYPEFLDAVSYRLLGVIIESKPAIDVLRDHDRKSTLHYVDPPYVFETRGTADKGYSAEMSREDHERLLTALRELKGMVCLSGYASSLYDDALHDWKRVEFGARDQTGKERQEVLWINPALVAAQAAGPAVKKVRKPRDYKRPVAAKQKVLI